MYTVALQLVRSHRVSEWGIARLTSLPRLRRPLPAPGRTTRDPESARGSPRPYESDLMADSTQDARILQRRFMKRKL